MMKIIGHRGAKGLAPENTLASFTKALEHGVDEIEFDVRLTQDNVVIVHHDPHLHDPAGNRLTIADTNYDVLLQHKPDLATFEEAMRHINKCVPALVEVKSGVNTKPIIAVVKRLQADGWQDKDMLFGSFSQSVLRQLHKELPTVPTVIIESWSGIHATMRARELGTKRLNMNQMWLWPGFIKCMQMMGYELAPYTLNNPAKAQKLSRYGIQAVITDYPDRYQK